LHSGVEKITTKWQKFGQLSNVTSLPSVESAGGAGGAGGIFSGTAALNPLREKFTTQFSLTY